MTDQPQQPSPVTEGTPNVRFEATVHPGEARTMDLDRIAELDVDRVPDPQGLVRVLVEPGDCVRLLAAGFEVRLHRALPIRPLSSAWVASEEQAAAWFEERTRAIGSAGSG